jgi:UPF0176 protein
MEKIILYYQFVPLSDPEAVRLWQKTLCEKLHLKGRILLSKHGINGTVGGDIKNVKAYVKETKAYFKGMAFKWSDGGREDFPRLSVKVRDEIVTFGAADELQVDAHGVVGGGKHLKPEQVHKLVAERGEDVVFFDGRNAYEAAVGKFKDAVVPDTRNTRDFLVKYGETYGDDGLWEGELYVFDKRMGVKFSDKAKDIGQCIHCQSQTSNYENCANKACNDLVLICAECKQEPDKLFHTTACKTVVSPAV